MFNQSSKGPPVPFVEAAHTHGRQRPTAIVLRSSFTTGERGAALAIANAWHNKYSKSDSCHYVVDEARTYRCVPHNVGAFPTGTGIYKNALSINVCHNPPYPPEDIVVARTAKLTAYLCKQHRIRLRLLDKNAEVRWVMHKWRSRGGIFLKTVGDFPADVFLDSVLSAYKAL